MIQDGTLLGHSYLLACILLWKCVFPVISYNANVSNDPINEHHKNSIAGSKQLLQNGNETQSVELPFLSLDNSSVYDEHKVDKSNNNNGSSNITGMQTLFQNSVNNSIIILKDDNGTESNLRNNFSNDTTKISYSIELTRSDGKTFTPNQSTIQVVPVGIPEIVKGKPNAKADTNTNGLLFNLTVSHTGDVTTSFHSEANPSILKQKHNIVKHLNLVPLEDEPFGGVLWKSNSKYVMSVCIPIGVGVVGAACIIGMAYAARRCYRNERKILEIRAALQQQISANRNDETVLLESSDDEM